MLERLLKELLRFHARSFLDTTVHEALARSPVSRDLVVLARASLGTLVSAASAVGNSLRAHKQRLELFGGRPLLPAVASKIPALRNRFGHDGTPPATASEAAEFFAHARALIDHLAEGLPPRFPLVIVVTSKTEDENGISYGALDDQDKKQTVHTDTPMQLYRRYYLLPRSNPVRVFPIVLEIPGDEAT